MIDFLRGQVALLATNSIVLDVQGVGYRVYMPNPCAFVKEDTILTVYTIHHVREDAMLLFGFRSREEQKLFRSLIDVSGVGPKVALGMLAGGKPENVATAIQQENVSFLMKLPGIGKKTAQRIIVDLKDKLDDIGFHVGDKVLMTHIAVSVDDRLGGAWGEAREALKALGYTDVELDRIWVTLQHHVRADEGIDSVMRKALQSLSKR